MSTPPKTHALLSELHRLLGNYSAEEFLNAASYPALPFQLRNVLRTLADEVDPRSGSSKSKSRPPSSSGGLDRLGRSLPRAAASSGTEVFEMIRRSPFFGSSGELFSLAKSLGIGLDPIPKESRERLARRLANTIAALPNGRKAQIVSQLGSGRKSQTEGWIDVISSARS